MIGKWTEGKKWQKKVETLKVQCRDKDIEIEKLKKNNEMLRHAVDRSYTSHVQLLCVCIASHSYIVSFLWHFEAYLMIISTS